MDETTTDKYKTMLRVAGQRQLDRLRSASGATQTERPDVQDNLASLATEQVKQAPQEIERFSPAQELEKAAEPLLRLKSRMAENTDGPDLSALQLGDGGVGYAQNLGVQGSMLSQKGQITQRFGNKSSIERFSGGVNYGTDVAVPIGTKVAVPEGDWVVLEAFSGADPNGGYIGNNANRGYGNSVLVKNARTGEMLRFSHLAQSSVRQGQVIGGGQIIGLSGNSGNTTGPHLDLEFYDRYGRAADILNTVYGASLLGRND